MKLPDKWGQGALFSYSGFDGANPMSNFFSAELCADKFGLVFSTENECTLLIGSESDADISFDTVMSDYIKAKIKCGDDEYTIYILFASENTVIIKSDRMTKVSVFFEKDYTVKKEKKGICYISGKDKFALASNNDATGITYAFSYGKNSLAQAVSALESDIFLEIDKKISAYDNANNLRIPNSDIEKLYYKCISVLRACFCTSDGIIKTDCVVPSKTRMNALYSFWSALCTLGLRHFAPDAAKSTLEAIISSAAPDGMISAKITPLSKDLDISPPILAWCMWELYCVNKDVKMLSASYSKLKKYLHYIMETRDINKNQLYEWQLSDDVSASGTESTMDNSPRFDDGIILDCVDLSSYIANEAYYMSLIADETDKHGEALYWNVVFERIKTSVNSVLFDEDDKIYYDRAVVSGMLKKTKTVSAFLPLFAGLCENRHAMALLRLLNNEDKFNLSGGIPSVSRDSDEYSLDMWRGPMHVYINYLIAKGLDKYEMHDKSNEIKAKVLETIISEYQNDGVLYEFYSAEPRISAHTLLKKGSGEAPFICNKNGNIRDFAPTAAIITDMLLSKSKKLPIK